MTIMERRALDKEELRRKIQAAARTLFIERGYENVTMREIARAIGYSPTTIYLYFKDKVDLVLSLCDETWTELLRDLNAIQPDPANPLDGLRRGMRAYIDFALRHPHQYAMLFITYPPVREVEERFEFQRSTAREAFQFLLEGVARCVEAGALKPIDPFLASQVLWSGMHGVASLLLTATKFPWSDREAVIGSVIDTLLAGLTA